MAHVEASKGRRCTHDVKIRGFAFKQNEDDIYKTRIGF